MKLMTFLEAKKLDNTMIGYGIDSFQVKRLQDYIGSWLKRFKIENNKVETYHITIAQIPEQYEKTNLIQTINNIKKGIIFNPKEIHLFKGKDNKTDYIVIEYKVNIDFINAFREVEDDYAVRYFGSIRPHVSLFSIKAGSISPQMWNDIKYSMPPLPRVKAKKVELWNKEFEIEFRS